MSKARPRRLQLEQERYLQQRALRVLAWAERFGVAPLELDHNAQSAVSSSAPLPPLAASRLLGAGELRGLSAASRGHCRGLGKFEVLIPMLRLVVYGFEEIYGLTEAAMERLSEMDRRSEVARAELSSLTKAQLTSLRTEMMHAAAPGRPPPCRPVLEAASLLLQPGQKAHDDFALQRLVADGNFVIKASSFRPDDMRQVQRQRLLKLMTLHSATVASTASRSDAAGALAQWLLAVRMRLDEAPQICGMYCAREAVLAHIVPLAKWVLRPHRRPLLARPVPPPDVIMGPGHDEARVAQSNCCLAAKSSGPCASVCAASSNVTTTAAGLPATLRGRTLVPVAGFAPSLGGVSEISQPPPASTGPTQHQRLKLRQPETVTAKENFTPITMMERWLHDNAGTGRLRQKHGFDKSVVAAGHGARAVAALAAAKALSGDHTSTCCSTAVSTASTRRPSVASDSLDSSAHDASYCPASTRRPSVASTSLDSSAHDASYCP